MTKPPARANKKWTKSEENDLVRSAKKNIPTKRIAKELERTESAIRSKASELDVSLKPKDPKQ